jgi:hypothetical protein
VLVATGVCLDFYDIFFPKSFQQKFTHISYIPQRAACPLDLIALGLFVLTILGGICNAGYFFLREFHNTCGINSWICSRILPIVQGIVYV